MVKAIKNSTVVSEYDGWKVHTIYNNTLLLYLNHYGDWKADAPNSDPFGGGLGLLYVPLTNKS